MTLRLLHIADVHLDRVFARLGSYGELAHRRREGLRDALRGAGEEARRHRCDLLTIGGDLYEGSRSGADTGRFLADLFRSWAPLRVVIAPGNHDPHLPGSLYDRTEWPDNVHVFSEPVLRPLPIGDGVTLWGLAHREPTWQGDPLAVDPVGAEGGVHVALFHGAELGSRPRGKSIHGPFHAADIARRGFALALCGHYHRRRVDVAGRLIYPGSPEPLTFEEEGDRGPVLVELGARGRITTEELATNRWHAVRAECDLEGVGSTGAVAERVRLAVREAVAPGQAATTMVRLTLRGEVAPEVPIDIASVEQLAAEAASAALVRILDVTSPAIDVAAAARDSTTRGAFTRELLAAIEAAPEGAERDVLEDALRYGLQALAGVDVGLRDTTAGALAP